MWGRSLPVLAALAAVLLPLAGCGPPPNRTTVTSPYYSFTAPGSFRSVTPPAHEYPEIEDASTLTELRDPNGTEIYAAVRRPPPGTDLGDLLRDQQIVAAQGLSRPIPVTVAGRPGVRIDGLRATGADGVAIGSRSVAFRELGRTYVVGCRWRTDPKGARDACDQVIDSFETN